MFSWEFPKWRIIPNNTCEESLLNETKLTLCLSRWHLFLILNVETKNISSQLFWTVSLTKFEC